MWFQFLPSAGGDAEILFEAEDFDDALKAAGVLFRDSPVDRGWIVKVHGLSENFKLVDAPVYVGSKEPCCDKAAEIQLELLDFVGEAVPERDRERNPK